MPFKKREKVLAEVDRQLAEEIERTHTELVSATGALAPPIVLEVLPSVRQRREAEAERLERDAVVLEARRRAAAAVNAAAEAAATAAEVPRWQDAEDEGRPARRERERRRRAHSGPQ